MKAPVRFWRWRLLAVISSAVGAWFALFMLVTTHQRIHAVYLTINFGFLLINLWLMRRNDE